MKSHKDLLAWQRAHSVVSLVVDGCQSRWRPAVFAVFHQLQRAALSVQINIAEGYASNSHRRFRHHLDIAYGSAIETAELLELAISKGFLPGDITERALEDCHHCQALVLGLIKRYRALQ